MDIEDIRLTPEEIDDAKADGVGAWVEENKKYTSPRMISMFIVSDVSKKLMDTALADAATGKAIKKILDLIGVYSSPYGYDIHNSCQLCGSQACIDTALADELSELRKLIEVKK